MNFIDYLTKHRMNIILNTKGKYYLTLSELLKLLKQHVDTSNVKLIKKAYYVARRAHYDQTRDEGTPYFDHPLRVAVIVGTEINLNNLLPNQRKFTLEEMICISLMHDVLEDTNTEYTDLATRFGDKIALGVQKLTKPEKSIFSSEDILKVYIKNIIKGGKELVLIKLCDRLDNIRYVKNCSLQKIISYTKETENYFQPLAKTYSKYISEQFITILKQLNEFIANDIKTQFS